jgi:hypothetical protein
MVTLDAFRKAYGRNPDVLYFGPEELAIHATTVVILVDEPLRYCGIPIKLMEGAGVMARAA